jgi:kynureninase
VGWDLAHAVGNAPLSLHAWDVDFAVWCSYKYLNSGPGGIGGLFVHDKHAETVQTEYAGWWGHERSTRFDMPREFVPIRGAQGFQQSNPDVLSVAALLGALQTFHDAGGMKKLREYSETLTQRLWDALVRSPFYVPATEAARAEDKQRGFTIVTPADPSARGAQLSLLFFPIGTGLMQQVFDGLKAHGVIGDERKPDVIRLAPVPLYNNEGDVDRAVTALDAVLKQLLKKTAEA